MAPLRSPLLVSAQQSPLSSVGRTPHQTLTIQTISRSATGSLRKRPRDGNATNSSTHHDYSHRFDNFSKTTPTSLTYTVNALTYIGDASFSISGAATAKHSGADVRLYFDRCITALGGGTVRDAS